jgi:hypothetical protein
MEADPPHEGQVEQRPDRGAEHPRQQTTRAPHGHRPRTRSIGTVWWATTHAYKGRSAEREGLWVGRMP